MEYYVICKVDGNEYLKETGDNGLIFTNNVEDSMMFSFVGEALFIKEGLEKTNNEELGMLKCTISLTPIEVVVKNKPIKRGDISNLV